MQGSTTVHRPSGLRHNYLAEFALLSSQVTLVVQILYLPNLFVYYYSTDYNLKINDIYECPKRVNFWWSPDFHHCDFHHRMIWPLMLDNWYQMSRFLNTDDFFSSSTGHFFLQSNFFHHSLDLDQDLNHKFGTEIYW